MKRIFTLASLFLAFGAVSFAQGEMDAFNLSYNELTGTARSVAMGGAFGALGADISGVAINPAGIGIYKSSEIATTINFTNTKTETNLGGVKNDMSKFNFTFDNLGIVGAVPLYSDEVPLLNFGFSYNKIKSFDRKINAKGSNLDYSLTDEMAGYANKWLDRGGSAEDITGNNAFSSGADWLSVLGSRGGLIQQGSNNRFAPTVADERVNSELYIREKGDISSYDFNVGTTISDVISIGATIAVTDITYKLESEYYEGFAGGGDYFLNNWMETEGSGWQVKAGVIVKPINELRIGVAYHSPTWYNMTDYYYSQIDAFNEVEGGPDEYYEYKFRTPDKWVLSLAGVIGQYAIISADYELTNYRNMTLKAREYGDYDFADENDFIDTDFKNSSTIRVGAEVRFTPQFSGRVGYMWQQSPIEAKLKDGSETGDYVAAIPSVSTVPHYSLVGDANYFTWGLGYRFTRNFYTDVAFIVKTRTDDLYSYGGADKTELKTNQFSGLMTLGFKF